MCVQNNAVTCVSSVSVIVFENSGIRKTTMSHLTGKEKCTFTVKCTFAKKIKKKKSDLCRYHSRRARRVSFILINIIVYITASAVDKIYVNRRACTR